MLPFLSNDDYFINHQTLKRWQNFFFITTLLSLILLSAHAASGATLVQINEDGVSVSHVSDDSIPPSDAMIVDGENTGDVVAVGRSIVVRGRVGKGVTVLGGDAIVEGHVAGDVGSIGGSVVQREGSYIGGDVIVVGGTYHHGRTAPGRNPQSTTVMVAGFEDELRDAFREPTSLLKPQFSGVYLVQRLLAVLFWFVISLGMAWSAPTAISRAAARLQLTSWRVAIIGFVSAVVMLCGVSVMLRFLPAWFSTIIGLMVFLLLMCAYLYGRVVVQAATGRWLQRVLLAEHRQSESTALFIGALFWVALLSLPYVWSVLSVALLIVSLGLVLTARYRVGWQREMS